MSSFSRLEGHRAPAFTRVKHCRASKSDLERDSGFSDASSEYLSTVDLTDSEDVGRTGSILGQDQVAMMGGSCGGVSPMIIMNNFVLKQPYTPAPADKQWSFPAPMASQAMSQSQLVLFQPLLSNGNSSSTKAAPESRRQSRSYVPILKSYARIAPHPGEAPSKRQGSSRVRSSVSGYDQRSRRRHHGYRLSSNPTLQPAPQTPITPVSNFETSSTPVQVPDNSPSEVTGVSAQPSYSPDIRTVMADTWLHTDKHQDSPSLADDKFKRFSNTYNILNQSGLLGITLRTKQLMRENRRTQGLLQQLNEQTALLMEALGTRDDKLWTKLRLSLQDTDNEQWGFKDQSILDEYVSGLLQ
ncbi:CLOCK-interacting pacemaker-like [Genypterus blacodes]|uniref:CLOCK-interacting pacemaker-like n=1 Tax=Genypterus blacodes TaxID=154954 RepID=UPI003F75AAC0